MLRIAFLCVSALLVHSISGQCIPSLPTINPGSCSCGGSSYGGSSGSSYGGSSGCSSRGSLGSSYSGPSLSDIASQLAASYGGSFIVTSTSPIAPGSVSISSDNLSIEGPLTVYGQMPFLSAVSLDGILSSGGSASASYSSGTNEIGILDEFIGTGAVSSGSGSYGIPSGYGNGYSCNTQPRIPGYSPGSGNYCGCGRY